jgi:hypothetical protein
MVLPLRLKLKKYLENLAFSVHFFCEKENEPKEIAPCDVALTGCPALQKLGGRCWITLSLPAPS